MKNLACGIIAVFALTLTGCGTNPTSIAKDNLKEMSRGKTIFARVGPHTITYRYLRREYGAYIRSNYPRIMWKKRLADTRAMHQYGERIALQTLLIVAHQNSGKSSPDATILLKAAVREGLSEFYLRSQADLTPIVRGKAYKAMDESMVKKLYKDNKKQYDAKKISEKAALNSLRYVLFKKKKEILERYLYSKRLGVLQDLMRRYKYDIAKQKGNIK